MKKPDAAVTQPVESYIGEAAILKSRQLQPALRRMQRWMLWTAIVISIALICVGQGLAWSRGIAPSQIRQEITSWTTLADFVASVSSLNAAGLMMLGIGFTIALPFVRVVIVAIGFVGQRSWIHVCFSLGLLVIMLLGLWWK